MTERSISVTGSKVTNEQLEAAFMPWVSNDYPNARNIGDVVLAMRGEPKIKYTTMKEYYDDQFMCGSDFTKLVLKDQYFVDLLERDQEDRLLNMLKSEPDSVRLLSIVDAVSLSMEIYHPEFGGNHLDSGYKSKAYRYKEAAELAITSYDTGNFVTVEDLPVNQNLFIPPSELIEVSRLTLQFYKVYSSLSYSGLLPGHEDIS